MKANKIFMRAFGRADLAFSSIPPTMTPGMESANPAWRFSSMAEPVRIATETPVRFGQRRQHVRKAYKMIDDICNDDTVELREMATYFEERGKPLQGEFLRKVADRHEVLAGAYSTASKIGDWVAFDVAEPEGTEIVQQYLGMSVFEQSNPPDWAFPTARWKGDKEPGATHWRYVEGPE